MKDELGVVAMEEFIGLRSKMYSCKIKRAKGVKKNIVKREIYFESKKEVEKMPQRGSALQLQRNTGWWKLVAFPLPQFRVLQASCLHSLKSFDVITIKLEHKNNRPVSEYLMRTARKLVTDKGILALPDPKRGHGIPKPELCNASNEVVLFIFPYLTTINAANDNRFQVVSMSSKCMLHQGHPEFERFAMNQVAADEFKKFLESEQQGSIDKSEVGAEMQRELNEGSKDNEGRMNKGNNEVFDEVQIKKNRTGSIVSAHMRKTKDDFQNITWDLATAESFLKAVSHLRSFEEMEDAFNICPDPILEI
eukprot:gene3894-15205_t